MDKWIDRMANRIRPIAVSSLMKYIVVTMGVVAVLDFLALGRVTGLLVFSRSAFLSGQFWRIISFIFIPVGGSLIFMALALYFYYMIGEALEREWGTAKFNLFYLTGIIGTIIAGFITGYATNFFLNLSLFLAFAILFPNFELLIFFILPVKMKWLAYIDAAYFLYLLAISSWPERIAILVAIANLILFFQGAARNRIHNMRRQQEWRKHFR